MEKILHHLQERMTSLLTPATLKKGVRGRRSSIASLRIHATVSGSGAVFFPSTVVLAPSLLFITRLQSSKIALTVDLMPEMIMAAMKKER